MYVSGMLRALEHRITLEYGYSLYWFPIAAVTN